MSNVNRSIYYEISQRLTVHYNLLEYIYFSFFWQCSKQEGEVHYYLKWIIDYILNIVWNAFVAGWERRVPDSARWTSAAHTSTGKTVVLGPVAAPLPLSALCVAVGGGLCKQRQCCCCCLFHNTTNTTKHMRQRHDQILSPFCF